MGHLSLYRKYRPQTFADVVGQEHVTETLRNAISEQRITHAYLFSGPRGTGKTSTARILAKALNCEEGPGPEPCNRCVACREITDGTSLDVVEIDAASHGSVDDARELRERVAYAPVGGRRKIYIYDECHMLSPAANNALLKVLEEPPGHVVFVFATTEPHKVLPTLLDRCQRYEFRPIDAESVAGRIAHVCESEGVAIEDEAVQMIATRASGSVRDGLTLLEQLFSLAGDKVTATDVTRLLGAVPDEILFEAVDIISERDVAAALLFTDRLIRSGRDIREFVRALVDHMRSLFLVLHSTAAQEVLDVSDERLERLSAQSNRFESGELLRVLDLANEVQLSLRQAVEGRLALEVGFARMTRPELHTAPTSMLSRIERLERLAGMDPQAAPSRGGGSDSPEALGGKETKVATPDPTSSEPQIRPARKPRTVPPTPGRRSEVTRQPRTQSEPGPATRVAPEAPAGSVDLEKIQRAWDLVLQGVKARKVSFSAVLMAARPSAYHDGELVLEFGPRSGWHREQASDREKQTPLIEAFFDTFGVRPVISCVLGEAEPGSARAPRGETEDQQAATMESEGAAPPGKTGADKDPVDLVKESFGAEIVEDA